MNNYLTRWFQFCLHRGHARSLVWNLYNDVVKLAYYWIANLIFFSHFALGVYYLVGWQWKEYHLIYWILMTAWIGSWLTLGYCPLSRAEFSLRKRYDSAIDPNREIIQYYIQKFFGILIPSKVIIFWGLIVYILLLSLSLIQYI